MSNQYDESKLPKWAQQELSRLRRDLAHERARLAEGSEDSTVFVDPYADTPQPLGTDPTIEFRGADYAERRTAVQVQRLYVGRAGFHESGLRISGTDGLVVQPTASNTIEVYPQRLR